MNTFHRHLIKRILSTRRLTKMSELYLPMLTGKNLPEPDLGSGQKSAAVSSQATTDEFLSKSQRLMLDLGLIQRSAKGLYNLLPVAQLAMDKLIEIIDEEMSRIGGQKITMPSLTRLDWWAKSGRWAEEVKNELFTVKDGVGHQFCLGPTHEEAVAMLFASQPGWIGRQRLPIYLYQITPKFRDEDAPRFGLLRAREFLMKDLYSFDATPDEARESYDRVCLAYDRIFLRLGLPVRKVTANVGNIGGSFSQEYHLPCSSGQDYIYYCPECRTGINREILDEANVEGTHDSPAVHNCPSCGQPMETERTIELAHAFILGQRYSKEFNVSYLDTTQGPQPVEMGCFGIGVSRLLAGCLDFCSPSSSELRWPDRIAPYSICVITPKNGSKEYKERGFSESLIDSLTGIGQSAWGMPVLWDDRGDMTVGKRFYQAKKLGWPIVIIGNKTVMNEIPKFEVYDARTGELTVLSHSETFGYLESVKKRF